MIGTPSASVDGQPINPSSVGPDTGAIIADTLALNSGDPNATILSVAGGVSLASTAFVINGTTGNVTLYTTCTLGWSGGTTLKEGGANLLEIKNAGSGVVVSSPNGTRYSITVSNIGIVTATAL